MMNPVMGFILVMRTNVYIISDLVWWLSKLVARLNNFINPPDGPPAGLERYPEDYNGQPGDPEPNWIKPIKIIVQNERDKQQLLLAFQYLHDQDIDTDLMAVNYLVHMYLEPDSIEVCP